MIVADSFTSPIMDPRATAAPAATSGTKRHFFSVDRGGILMPGAMNPPHPGIVLVDLDGCGLPFQADDFPDEPLLPDLHDIVQTRAAQARRFHDGTVDPDDLAFDH